MSTASRSGPTDSASLTAWATAPAISRSRQLAEAAERDRPSNGAERALPAAPGSTPRPTRGQPVLRRSVPPAARHPPRPVVPWSGRILPCSTDSRQSHRDARHRPRRPTTRPFGVPWHRRRGSSAVPFGRESDGGGEDAHGRDREAPDRGPDQRKRVGAKRSRGGSSPRRRAPDAYTTAGWGGNGTV